MVFDSRFCGRRAATVLRGATALMLLAFAGVCAAANHVVYLNDDFPPYHMKPNDITIAVGDTVTFSYTNNNESHNVHALDDSFRCSDGCRGDGTGATGAPKRSSWSAMVKFTKPGIVKYGCDAHPGTFQEPAAINVVAAAAAVPLGGYMSGNWYNASQSGHGFELEFTNQPSDMPGQNTVVAYWYVYAPDGSGQNWIVAAGPYDSTSNTVTLPAFVLTGAGFPPMFDSNALKQTDWGKLTFTFSDCNNGTASWASNMAGYGSGSLPITRITQVAGTTCPQ